MASACALAMFSGKIILNFGVQKRLRAFLNPIFTRRGRDGKRQLPRWFLRKQPRGGGSLHAEN